MAGPVQSAAASGPSAFGRPFGAADLAWMALLIAGLALPVSSAADWLNPTYTTTPADLRLGLWILKVSMALAAVAGFALPRLAVPAAPATERAVTARESILIPGVIVVVALGLRLHALDTELWLDEVEMLVRYVPLEFRQLVSTYDTQNHHPLYTILARVSWLLAGGAEWAVRLPAVAFGVASIVLLRQFGRTIVTNAEANLAALVLAVSYHHVWFSQNARGYTGIMFFCIGATWVFLRLAGAPGKHPWRTAWLYGVLMAAATWTHMTAAFIAVGHLLALLITAGWRDGTAVRRIGWPVIGLALSALLTVALYAPMLPRVVRELTEPASAGISEVWTNPAWMVAEVVRGMASGVPGGVLSVMLALLVLGIGLASLWRVSAIATLVMFVPVVVTAGVIMATGHNLWPRFFFFAAGFLVLAAIRGGFAMVRALVPRHPERVATSGAVAVALLSLLTVPRAWQPKQQFRAALDFVEREARGDDAKVAVDIVSNVFAMRGWAREWYEARSAGMLSRVEQDAGRTWVVYTLPTRLRAVAPDVWELVAPPRYDVVRVFPATVGGGEIHVLRRERPDRND
jgi:hypothetical protein